MSENVVSLIGKREDDVASADVVECLEKWTEMAKRGEITSLAIAGSGPGKASVHGCSVSVDTVLLGAIVLAQQLVIKALTED